MLNASAYICILLCFLGGCISFRLFEEQPNIVVVIVDDLGYGDLASYGHPTQEWNSVDQMAADGLKFTQFYAADSLCTPARAALLTGRYPVRSGMVGGQRVFYSFERGGLPYHEITIPEMLKTVGYRTGMVGKWHLGLNAYNSFDGTHLPHNHGFDFVGINLPLTNFWQCDETGLFQPNGPTPQNCFLYNGSRIYQQPINHRHLTHLLLDGFRTFLDQQSHANPFFFYFSFPQVHTSLFSMMTKFVGSSKRGLYGGDLNEMAWGVGEILSLLERHHFAKRTLVFFLSDHGPHTEICHYGGDAGVLTGGKANSWEGGFRIPAIAYWPGVIAPQGSSASLLSTLDLFPTFAKLAGAHVPHGRILDGLEKLDVLLGYNSHWEDDRPIFYYCNRHVMAVRYGHYKVHYVTVPLFDDEQREINCPGGIPIQNFMMSQTCPDHDLIVLVPPLIYNLAKDPQERYPLDPADYVDLLKTVSFLLKVHKASVEYVPDQIGRWDPSVVPCCNPPFCRCNY